MTTATQTPAIEAELLTVEESKAALRAALGPGVSEEQLDEAVSVLRTAQAAKWEQLPPEIDQDMGYHYRFLACSETCWLGRQILLEGATFRVLDCGSLPRRPSPPLDPPLTVGYAG